MKWIAALPENRRRGSFPRCALFMEGEPAVVADRLTKLVGLPAFDVGGGKLLDAPGIAGAQGQWRVGHESHRGGKTRRLGRLPSHGPTQGSYKVVAGGARTSEYAELGHGEHLHDRG